MQIDINTLSDVRTDEISEIAAIEADNFGSGALNQWHLPVAIRYGKVFVIRRNGVIAGASELMTDWQEPESVFIIGFSIAEPYQCQGLGKKLLTAIINYLRDDGRRFLLLTVAADNKRALKLYDNFGFKESKILRNEYGQGVNRLLLRLDINGADYE